MKLYIDGDLNRYYAQTLCMIFFPGAKFSDNEIETRETPVASIKLLEQEGRITVEACLRKGGGGEDAEETECASHTVGYIDGERDRAAKLASGVAVFTAGKRLFGDAPPWGILTGVRPTKIAAELLHSGLGVNEIEAALTNEFFVNPKKASLLTDIVINEEKIIKKLDNDTCSFYISIPFCPTRCAYCSFVSYSTKRLLSLIPEYLDRLIRDISEMVLLINSLGQKIKTVYIGGGTPTILTADQLDRLLGEIESLIDLSSVKEFTLEAGRPDTITPKKLEIAKKRGISRVSVNPQTLNDAVLENIGRRHTSAQFFEAYHAARQSEIKHINVDLIAGLPEESFASFSKTVDSILELRPDNITVHTFCVKKSADILKAGTEIYSREGRETGKSVDYSQLRAKNAGYLPYYLYRQKNTVGNYENAGFALEGAEGLYNIFMMEEVHSVFAAGAGAVTKLVNRCRDKIERVFMPKYPYEYLAMDSKAIKRAEFEGVIRNFYEKTYN